MSKQLTTLLLRDLFNQYEPLIDTKHMSFTEMKNLLREIYNYKGKMTGQAVSEFFAWNEYMRMKNTIDNEKKETINEIKDIKKDIGKQVNRLEKVSLTSAEKKQRISDLKNQLIQINHQLGQLARDEKELLQTVAYDLDEQENIIVTAFHDINDLDVDHDVVENFLDEVRANPTN